MNPAPPHPAARVLIADDDADIRLLLRLALSRDGYEPHIVESGAAALAAVARIDFAACILDVRMPDISGLDVCQAIKATAATAHIPVIILSAQPDSGTSDAGFDVYMTKPFELVELTTCVAALLSAAT